MESLRHFFRLPPQQAFHITLFQKLSKAVISYHRSALDRIAVGLNQGRSPALQVLHPRHLKSVPEAQSLPASSPAAALAVSESTSLPVAELFHHPDFSDWGGYGVRIGKCE
jgi:hypothetical protein